MKRPQPPERLLNIDPLDNVDFEPAKELEEWIIDTFISSDGKLYNPDHAHISPWSSTLFKVLWASSAFIKADRVVLGQTEKFAPMAGGWRKLRQEKQMIDWFGCVPDFIITIDAKFASQASDTEFCALIEHELYHLGAKRDEDGNYLISPSTGEYKYYLRPHDVEEFYGVVKRWGASDSVKRLVEITKNAPFVSDFNVSACCGNCVIN